MDQDSKDLLKRNLFVQGLKLRWQEQVLPSAETFADALHQARAAEEQDRQLGEMHLTRGGLPRPKGQPDKVQRRGEPPAAVRERDTLAPPNPSTGKCFRYKSTRHKARDCPQRKPPGEAHGCDGSRAGSNLAVLADPAASECLDRQCQRLRGMDHSRV